MKTSLLLLLAALAFAGCASIEQHNAQTRADLADIAAGRAAAEQSRAIALQVQEAIKGIKPSH